MLGLGGQAGGDQQGADLVAVQARCVGLTVDLGTADVRGRGVLEQVLLDLGNDTARRWRTTGG